MWASSGFPAYGKGQGQLPRSLAVPLYGREEGALLCTADPGRVGRIASALPESCKVTAFHEADGFARALQADSVALEADLHAHRTLIDDWERGAGDLRSLIIDYWIDRPRGTRMPRLALVDAQDMDGHALEEALRALVPFAQTRLVIADADSACRPTLRSLVDRGLVDFQLSHVGELNALAPHLLQRPQNKYQEVWCRTLTHDQATILGHPAVAASLGLLRAADGWKEWVFVGDPFGILALCEDGMVLPYDLGATSPLGVSGQFFGAEGQYWMDRRQGVYCAPRDPIFGMHPLMRI